MLLINRNMRMSCDNGPSTVSSVLRVTFELKYFPNEINPIVFLGSLGTFLNVLVVYFLSVVCSDVITADKNVKDMKIFIHIYEADSQREEERSTLQQPRRHSVESKHAKYSSITQTCLYQ